MLNWRRICSVVLTFSVFTTNCLLAYAAETNLWSERQHSTLRNPTPAVVPPLDVKLLSSPIILSAREKTIAHLPARFQNLIRALPLSRVNLQEIHDSGNSGGPILAVIQDVHMNIEAQINIAAALQALIDQKQIDLVGAEGAFSKFDFSRFRAFREKSVVKFVAESFLNNSILAAPSYVGITSAAEPPAFVGVDDKRHYSRNVQDYLAARNLKASVTRDLKSLGEKLNADKNKIFSPELRRFDDVRGAYHRGEIGLGAYARELSAIDPQRSIHFNGSPLARFLEASNTESSLNFPQVEQERAAVIEKLTRALDEREKSELMATSVAYHFGKLGFGDYYRTLKNLCEKKGIALRQTPAFDNYIRYVLLADEIQADALFASLARVENEIQDRLATSTAEKNLLRSSERLLLAGKLIEFSLMPAEWEKYRMLSAASNQPSTDNLKPFEQFYEEANARSRLMVENLFSNVKTGSAAVLLAGGFHTPLIEKFLRERNVSYVVLSPKMSKIDNGSGSAYLSVFAREKTPLEELFAGEKLSLKLSSQEITALATDVQTTGSILARIGAAAKAGVVHLKIVRGRIVANLIVSKRVEPARDLDRLSNGSWPTEQKWSFNLLLILICILKPALTPFLICALSETRGEDVPPADQDLIQIVAAWLAQKINLDTVPTETILRLIDPASRHATLQQLLQSVSKKSSRNFGKWLLSSLKDLDDVITQSVRPKLSVVKASDFAHAEELFRLALEKISSGGSSPYPFSLSALKEFHKNIFGLHEALLKIAYENRFRIGGFGLDPKTKTRERKIIPGLAGFPQAMVDARLLRIKNKSFPLYRQMGVFERGTDAVVPFIGGFYRADGSEISEQEMAATGLEWVKDEQRQNVRFPVFAATVIPSRVLTIPLAAPRMIVIIDPKDHSFQFLLTIDDMEKFILAHITDGADELDKIREQAKQFARQGIEPETSYIFHLIGFLKKSGYEHAFPLTAIRYKGIGGHYRFHPMPEKELRSSSNPFLHALHEHEQIVRPLPGVAYVRNQQLVGKSGIFFFHYQSGFNTAMGALSSGAVDRVERDRTLLQNGAMLSTINLGAVQLTDRSALRAWGIPDNINPPEVTLEAVTDDTRNLMEVMNTPALFLESIADDPTAARTSYMGKFADALGSNVAGILKSGLSLRPDDIGLQRNLIPWGNLRDTEELEPIKIPQQSMFAIRSMLGASAFVGKNLGMTEKEWVDSPLFHETIEYFLAALSDDEQRRDNCLAIVRNLKSRVSPADVIWVVTPILYKFWLNASHSVPTEKTDWEFAEILSKYPQLTRLRTTWKASLAVMNVGFGRLYLKAMRAKQENWAKFHLIMAGLSEEMISRMIFQEGLTLITMSVLITVFALPLRFFGFDLAAAATPPLFTALIMVTLLVRYGWVEVYANLFAHDFHREGLVGMSDTLTNLNDGQRDQLFSFALVTGRISLLPHVIFSAWAVYAPATFGWMAYAAAVGFTYFALGVYHVARNFRARDPENSGVLAMAVPSEMKTRELIEYVQTAQALNQPWKIDPAMAILMNRYRRLAWQHVHQAYDRVKKLHLTLSREDLMHEAEQGLRTSFFKYALSIPGPVRTTYLILWIREKLNSLIDDTLSINIPPKYTNYTYRTALYAKTISHLGKAATREPVMAEMRRIVDQQFVFDPKTARNLKSKLSAIAIAEEDIHKQEQFLEVARKFLNAMIKRQDELSMSTASLFLKARKNLPVSAPMRKNPTIIKIYLLVQQVRKLAVRRQFINSLENEDLFQELQDAYNAMSPGKILSESVLQQEDDEWTPLTSRADSRTDTISSQQNSADLQSKLRTILTPDEWEALHTETLDPHRDVRDLRDDVIGKIRRIVGIWLRQGVLNEEDLPDLELQRYLLEAPQSIEQSMARFGRDMNGQLLIDVLAGNRGQSLPHPRLLRQYLLELQKTDQLAYDIFLSKFDIGALETLLKLLSPPRLSAFAIAAELKKTRVAVGQTIRLASGKAVLMANARLNDDDGLMLLMWQVWVENQFPYKTLLKIMKSLEIRDRDSLSKLTYEQIVSVARGGSKTENLVKFLHSGSNGDIATLCCGALFVIGILRPGMFSSTVVLCMTAAILLTLHIIQKKGRKTAPSRRITMLNDDRARRLAQKVSDIFGGGILEDISPSLIVDGKTFQFQGSATAEKPPYMRTLPKIYRIGPLVFVVLSPQLSAESIDFYTNIHLTPTPEALQTYLQEAEHTLRAQGIKNLGNIFFMTTAGYSLSMAHHEIYLSLYQALLIADMLAHAEKFKGHAVEWGAGHAPLAAITLGLGARVTLIERDPEALALQCVYLIARGYQEGRDFSILRKHFDEISPTDPNIADATVGIANVGSPGVYWNANQIIIDMVAQLPNMHFFINGGFATNYSVDEAGLASAHKGLRTAGYHVSTHIYTLGKIGDHPLPNPNLPPLTHPEFSVKTLTDARTVIDALERSPINVDDITRRTTKRSVFMGSLFWVEFGSWRRLTDLFKRWWKKSPPAENPQAIEARRTFLTEVGVLGTQVSGQGPLAFVMRVLVTRHAKISLPVVQNKFDFVTEMSKVLEEPDLFGPMMDVVRAASGLLEREHPIVLAQIHASLTQMSEPHKELLDELAYLWLQGSVGNADTMTLLAKARKTIRKIAHQATLEQAAAPHLKTARRASPAPQFPKPSDPLDISYFFELTDHVGITNAVVAFLLKQHTEELSATLSDHTDTTTNSFSNLGDTRKDFAERLAELHQQWASGELSLEQLMDQTKALIVQLQIIEIRHAVRNRTFKVPPRIEESQA